MVEPVGMTSQQTVGLGIAGDGRLNQSMGEPSPAVIGLFTARFVGRISEDVAVGLAAGFDAIDQLVESFTQLRVLEPTQGVASAHEESAGAGTAQIRIPEANLFPVVRRIFLAGAFPEGHEQVIDREGIQQVGDVVVHHRFEKPLGIERDTAGRRHCGVGHRFPGAWIAGFEPRLVLGWGWVGGKGEAGR